MSHADIAVHGAGYLGMSTAMHYAARTPHRVHLFDTAQQKRDQLMRGECPVPGLERWGGYRVAPLVREGRIVVAHEPPTGHTAPYHFIAVPTHKNGDEPSADMQYVEMVLETLERGRAGNAQHVSPRVVVIESTLAPWDTDRIAQRIHKLGAEAVIATRRDWFADSKWNLQATPRVAWASQGRNGPGATLLREVCDDLHFTDTAYLASLVKVAENALYHVEISFAQEMALAFPGVDTVRLMELIGTHPSRPKLHPSGRVGGYCVPFGSRTTVQAAQGRGGELAAEALRTNARMAERVLGLVLEGLGQTQPKRALLLGITYRPDTKVTAESLVRYIATRMLPHGVAAYDPWYSQQEVYAELGVGKFGAESALPVDQHHTGLREYGVIVVGTSHAEFGRWFRESAETTIEPGTLVIDSLGAWEHAAEALQKRGIDYRRIGRFGWSAPVRRA